MPSKIVSNQIYAPGEHPIFIAYIYHNDALKTPLAPSEVTNISVTHNFYGTGLSNGQITTGYFPVKQFDSVTLDSSCLSEVVPYVQTNAFDYADTTQRFDYNFVYIPKTGRDYYTRVGSYRTVFTMDITDGTKETFIYDTKVQKPTITEQTVSHGYSILIIANIYTKYLESVNKVRMPSDCAFRLRRVYLTVFRAVTFETILGRHEIDYPVLNDRITDTNLVASFPHDFRYQFETQKLPGIGQYVLQFEIETDANDIPCTFEIPLTVN